ncbi:MAG: hypothetical protein R3A13_01780 [Bdellovibrionota bacterium]
MTQETASASLSQVAREVFDVDLNALSGPKETGLRSKLKAIRAALGLDNEIKVAYDSSWKAVVEGLKDLEKQALTPSPEFADLDVLQDHADKLQEVIKKLKVCRAALNGGCFFARRIDDKTIEYRVAGPTNGESQEDHIRERLKGYGDDAKVLISRLKVLGVDLSKKAPTLSEGTLRTDSNYKTLYEQKALYGGELLDDIQAVNFCMEAVTQAKEAGVELRTVNNEGLEDKGKRVEQEALDKGLDQETATMLKMLTSGVLRTRSAALSVDAYGRLYALRSLDFSFPGFWAVGAVAPAAE